MSGPGHCKLPSAKSLCADEVMFLCIELKLPLYEERRKVGINEVRAKELESGMLYLANRVKDPKDIDLILNND